MSKTLYDILGVSPDAESGDIKKAYRTKAQRLHPDKETGDEEAFKELLEAYDVLMDATRRKYYDENGTVPEQEQNTFIQEAVMVILHLIDRVDSVKTTNLIAAAVQIVNGSIRKAQEAKEAITEQIDERKEAAARLSCKKGENHLGIAILSNVKVKEAELAHFTGLEAEGRRILDYLKNYEYKADRKEQEARGGYRPLFTPRFFHGGTNGHI